MIHNTYASNPQSKTSEGYCRMSSARRLLIREAKEALMNQTRSITSPNAYSTFLPLRSAIVRPAPSRRRSIVTMNKDDDPNQLEAIVQQNQALRFKMRKALKSMDPIQRSQEDNAIQNFVLEAPWFKPTVLLYEKLIHPKFCQRSYAMQLKQRSPYIFSRQSTLSTILAQLRCNSCHYSCGDSYNSFSTQEGCAQIRRNLYLPHIEDWNSNMRMLKISSLTDLITNSMNILEPSPVDCDGNQRKDVMQASEPVDLFVLPGLAFDRLGRRLGRSGGYYDMFLKKYKDLASKRNWKQPLLGSHILGACCLAAVALSYSLQIVDEGAIAITHNDVPVDAIVSPAGFIPTSPAATKMSD
ncbi:hypothetical protein ACSBR1_006636 [Camellia fascicularis]